MPLRAFLYRHIRAPSAITVDVDGEIYSVRVRRHNRARRYTLRIHTAGREIVLTMPPRGSLREARAFAQTHRAWIASRLRRWPDAVPFAHGAVVPLRGVEHRIEHRLGVRGTVWLEKRADENLLCVAGDEAHVSRRLRDFLKREAKYDLEVATRHAAQALGVHFRRISLRDPSSRWGSCSSTGVLSYSWRLILAPSFVLEYLAAHEVAHLVEMNHSPHFWRLVERIYPRVGRAKAWLNAHGSDLHRYGLDTRLP
jgi:predicted metal-dependent hydrolase